MESKLQFIDLSASNAQQTNQLGIEYFESVVSLQKQHSQGKKVTNTIQTNGTLLTEEWGKFLSKHNFLVGLSIDGPHEIHDK